MSATLIPNPSASPDAAAVALVEATIGASIGAVELACLYLGERLGLYHALAAGPATARELAERAACDERYVREWLEQQAAAGVLACDDPSAAPSERRFALPVGHDVALTDADSLASVGGIVRSFTGFVAALPAVVEAFRTGAGISYADYGEDVREGIAAANRPHFNHLLAADWFPAMPEVHDRLSASPARVADFACGCGWSSLAIARAYPLAFVDGLDEDAASITRAREHASEAGLDGRVRFVCSDAADASLTGSYDLVTMFQALHDMAQPVEALEAARALLGEGGSVLIADQRAGEHFAAPAEDPFERLCYGASVLHCLPVGRVAERSEATGTVIRPHTVRDYATRAGFSRVDVLPIEHDIWRFYRLLP
jgi:2-polyprenyl-3-methyl-5-hydroxy-6-metoxy-1,4-benzoquinol methylase